MLATNKNAGCGGEYCTVQKGISLLLFLEFFLEKSNLDILGGNPF